MYENAPPPHMGSQGYHADKKRSKTDLGPTTMKKRVKFCKKHSDKNANAWKAYLQGVGDFKEFTWYPRELQPRFQKLRASWTYMNKRERKLPAFQRPKKWFKLKDWKKTKKMKVFGLTTSNGKQLCFEVPFGKDQFSAAKWAVYLKKRVAPFLKNSFPGKTSFHLLLDGEKLLHAPEAQAAMDANHISTLKDWPGYSPELNPQEHVWKAVRRAISHNHTTPRLPELAEQFEQHLTFGTFQSSFLDHYGFNAICPLFK